MVSTRVHVLAVTGIALSATLLQPQDANALQVYQANLNGPSEAPPNASPGTGTAVITIDEILNTMLVEATFSGLTGTTTAAHIHGPTTLPGSGTAGVATTTPTFTGFPLVVTSGAYTRTFDMTLASSYNPAFITANGGTPASAQQALFSAIASGRAYFNVHTTAFPGGEIRGFLLPKPDQVPAPLPVLGAAAAFGFSRKLRKRIKATGTPAPARPAD